MATIASLAALLLFSLGCLHHQPTVAELTDDLSRETPRPRLLLNQAANYLPALKVRAPNVAGRRMNAAQELGRLGAQAEAAIPALLAKLADSDDVVASESAAALGRIGIAAERPLLPLLQSEQIRARQRAAYALSKMKPRDAKAITALTEALHAPDKLTRLLATLALSEAGPSARSGLPALRNGLRDADAEVQVWSAFALWQIDRERALKPLGEYRTFSATSALIIPAEDSPRISVWTEKLCDHNRIAEAQADMTRQAQR